MLQIRGMSVNALELAADMARGHLANVLSGRRLDISSSTALRLARALGVTLDWLVSGEGAMPSGVARPRTTPAIATSEPLQERAAQRVERAAESLRRDLARTGARAGSRPSVRKIAR
jgi:transcriptional regulator with XRE-family HTH domain